MQLTINGNGIFAATGGRPHAAGKPLAVFVHGAGLNHTVWALQSRWFAFHGWNVLALDLPGHGASTGAPLPSVRALSQWLLALLNSVNATDVTLIGHSMGSLIALETAADNARIKKLILVGAAAAMPVNAELLAAAKGNDHVAIDMVNLWGYGLRAGFGESRTAGVWMTGIGERILERAQPGVLYTDLAACNAYAEGLAAAVRVAAPTLLFCGEKDQMTPLKRGRVLAAALPCATLVVAEGAGHMLLAERPVELLTAMTRHLQLGAAPVHRSGT